MTLADLDIGAAARVTAIDAESPVMLRLMEMGLVPGISIRLLKRSPFGGPMEIRVLGSRLCIRRHEARHLSVAAVEAT